MKSKNIVMRTEGVTPDVTFVISGDFNEVFRKDGGPQEDARM